MNEANIARISRLANQLLGDLDGVDEAFGDRTAQSQQKLQLILDAFEQCGDIALESRFKEEQRYG